MILIVVKRRQTCLLLSLTIARWTGHLQHSHVYQLLHLLLFSFAWPDFSNASRLFPEYEYCCFFSSFFCLSGWFFILFLLLLFFHSTLVVFPIAFVIDVALAYTRFEHHYALCLWCMYLYIAPWLSHTFHFILLNFPFLVLTIWLCTTLTLKWLWATVSTLHQIA